MTTPSLSSADRRAAARRARDAFPPMGVYAIRDRVAGRARVGSSRNVHATINRIGFELRLRTHPDKALQAEWNASPDRYSFEVLALVKERDDPAFDYAEELRTLEALYREEEQA
ncbi:GIY-YIG nuclease family protein [Ramlibacter sp. USB13]|uniref:GIY-YIG nuclease family protein n=1 Tax=Ramlibacter cellulosilyticus TaxID=2764187 RepID=A0A923SD38_9BURK|nr:GIY-YIG nuclease family protein [Ramlibacter cellulosilyticus]MBC5781542.1 GIY-YIG nuclease family protein [Ramlibacter cellulosilyticus]